MLTLMNTNNDASLSEKVKVDNKLMPTPYGTIPKRSKKSMSAVRKSSGTNTPTRRNSSTAPCPCFSLAPTSTSFFLSVFNTLFSKERKEEKPVGFMPCSSTDKIQMSQIVDIAVSSSSPIDCHYGNDDGKEQDTCSSLSSTSSSSSESSILSSIFSYNLDTLDDENSQVSISHHNNSSNSTEILSDLLCDHYVQTLKNGAPSLSDDVVIDVPLETFRMFEAPTTATTTTAADADTTSSHKRFNYDNCMWSDEVSTKEWKLIETKQKKDEIIIQIQKEEKIPPVGTDDVSPKTAHQKQYTRDIRANAAYLRMIVAEVNMMRSQKIVGPLRPRRVLPKRLDNFMHRPSPLQSIAA